MKVRGPVLAQNNNHLFHFVLPTTWNCIAHSKSHSYFKANPTGDFIGHLQYSPIYYQSNFCLYGDLILQRQHSQFTLAWWHVLVWWPLVAPVKHASNFSLYIFVNIYRQNVTIVKLDHRACFVVFCLLFSSGWTASIKAARQSERY